MMLMDVVSNSCPSFSLWLVVFVVYWSWMDASLPDQGELVLVSPGDHGRGCWWRRRPTRAQQWRFRGWEEGFAGSAEAATDAVLSGAFVRQCCGAAARCVPERS